MAEYILYFKHFKTGHIYILKDIGPHTERDEITVSYYWPEEPRDMLCMPPEEPTTHFSSLRRFIEDVDRPEDGFPLQPRFAPVHGLGRIWRDGWREKLGVTVEVKKPFSGFNRWTYTCKSCQKDTTFKSGDSVQCAHCGSSELGNCGSSYVEEKEKEP